MDTTDKYINHIKLAFINAEKGISKISCDIMLLDGMSGTKTRHFYNNLLTIDDARYLEIGTWKGSSLCSAMYGNMAKITCVDNWSEWGGPKDEFNKNLENFKGENDVKVIEKNCFDIDVNELSRFNIYLYDGDHSEDSHFKALTHFYDCMDDIFIYIVDDWNMDRIRNGTYKAIEELKLKKIFEKEIRLTSDNTHTPIFLARHTWWNGIYVVILRK